MTTEVRAVDWRFLVAPDPELGRTLYVGDADAPMLAGLRSVTADVVATQDVRGLDPTVAAFDTVVIAADATDAVAAAGAMLGRGGLLYVALPRRAHLPGTNVRGWCRALRRLGFEDVVPLWHVPRFDIATHIVPLAGTGALRLLAQRHQGSRRGAMKAIAVRVSAATRSSTFLAGDVAVVARRRDDPARGRHPCGHSLLVTPRFRTSRHVIRLDLDPGAGRVRSVVKLPRLRSDSTGIEHEAAVLRRLAVEWPEGRGSYPSVEGLRRPPAYPTLTETPVAGTPLTHRAAARGGDAVVDRVEQWLLSLPVTRRTSEDPTWFDRLLERPLLALAAQLPPAHAGRALVAATLDQVDVLRSHDLPLVLEHGDVTAPNIFLRPDGGVGMVDWELTEPFGLPGSDFFHFLAFVGFARTGTTEASLQAAAFDDCFFGPHAWAQVRARRHLQLRGVAPQLLQPLLVATWARYVAHAAPRLRQLALSTGDTEGRLLAELLAHDRDATIWRRLVGEHAASAAPRPHDAEERAWVI